MLFRENCAPRNLAPHGMYFSTCADSRPLPAQLRELRGSSGNVVKVKEQVCAKWEDVATQLSFSQGLIDIIKKNEGPEKAFDDLMKRWLNGTNDTRQPITWRTLLIVFRKIDHNTLASDLENVLPEVSWFEN